MGKITLIDHLKACAIASGNYIKGVIQAVVAVVEELDTVKANRSELDKLKNELKTTINFVPTQGGSLTYTGTEQSPVWNDYSPNTLTISGTLKATKAGTYTATFTPKEGYQWSDGGKDGRKATWKIDAAVRPSAES